MLNVNWSVRVAFVTGNAFDILTSGGDGVVGGAQIQQYYVGKELAKRGHDVYYIEDDGEGKSPLSVDGLDIRLRKRPDERGRVRQVSSWVHHTYRVLSDITPDICYCRVLSFDIVPVLIACRLTGTKCVYNFAHDSEVTEEPVTFDSQLTQSGVYKKAMNLALESFDTLIAQNEFQYNKAVERFDAKVSHIPNGYPIKSVSTEQSVVEQKSEPIALWIGTIRSEKDPKALLNLAEKMPDVTFLMAGGKRDEEADLYDEVEREAAEMENVDFRGFVPHSEVLEYYAAADVFVNTSISEGFPNTFLEAWAHGTPVASFRIDPDKIIERNGLGVVGDGTIESMKEGITTILNEESGDINAKCRDYLRENHSIETITNQYENLFREVIQQSK